MTYTTAMANIVAGNRVQIEADLDTARQELEEARAVLAATQRRVFALEWMVSLRADSRGSERSKRTPELLPEQLTLHAAMVKVLKESPEGRLRAADIIAEIERRGLYRMRDGRLPESQQIHARAGHYPELIGKDGSYFYAK